MQQQLPQARRGRAAAVAAGLVCCGIVLAAGTAASRPAAGGPAAPDTPVALPSRRPPANAVILLGAGGAAHTDPLAAWQKRDGSPAAWKVEENGRVIVAGGGDIMTRQRFGDIRLHVEFNVPSMPQARGQARGNSGVYLNGRYEVQVLDSYGPALDPPGRPLGKDECGAIYGQAAPRVNATLPPGTWQTYDIWFRAPRYEKDGSLALKPRLTVVHNGVLIHENVEVGGATRAGLGDVQAAREGPVLLQDHGNPVRYRNIWLAPLR